MHISPGVCQHFVRVSGVPEAIDLELLQRIAARDDTALAALYNRHCRAAYSLILRILRSPADADDVLQETFVRVWTRADTYDARLGAPVAWLIRIARNRAIDRVRARRVRADISVAPAEREDGSVAVPEPVTRTTPEHELHDTMTTRAIGSALTHLPAVQRELIEAAFFDGYTHHELAARFGVPLGTVKTRIRSGLASLRGHLEEFGMIPDDVEALALADAVGALDAEERRELAARLGTLEPEARAEVARLYDTVAVVAGSVDAVAPPPYVRDRVLAATHTPGRYTLLASVDDWFDTPFPGIRGRVLAVDRAKGVATLFLRAEPGAIYPAHDHHGAEECFVLRGMIVIDGRTLHAGDFHHADDGSTHGEITTVSGADVLVVGAIEDYLPGL